MSYDNGYGGGGSTEFMVPTDQVGRIIGKGGSRISEIKYESGANINVSRESNNGETQVSVTGSEECRQKAQQMIMDIVNRAGQGGGGGGYGGGRGGGGGYGGGY